MVSIVTSGYNQLLFHLFNIGHILISHFHLSKVSTFVTF